VGGGGFSHQMAREEGGRLTWGSGLGQQELRARVLTEDGLSQ